MEPTISVLNTFKWAGALVRAISAAALLSSIAGSATGQQFAGDNQWVAPHGVGTFVATAGEEYAQVYAIAALLPEWEFNAQFNYFYDDPRDSSGSYTAVNLYAKRRIWENEAGNAGYSVLFGTGLYPEHLERGTVASAFRTWWGTATATFALFGNHVLLDVLPGALVNFDESQSGQVAWGFTYTSRVAAYGVIPHSALVGEVFGTAGEASADPAFRFGVRWESQSLIIAGTYASTFSGQEFAGFEIGAMYFTPPIFCFSGCSR